MKIATAMSRLILFYSLSVLILHAQAAPPASSLQFESSDTRLVEAFRWAKAQALAYAHSGSDPVGPWYEAALPGREAFCMRDVAHQTTGAAALGLYAQNRNMLQHFAAAVSPARGWTGYWEIDKAGQPSSADYLSDNDFWYNLPANFDILDSIVRMARWTGDENYLNNPSFQRFFQSTATQYVNAWQLQPERILQRPRIMNQHQSKGKFVQSRGIPSYTEGEVNFNLGADLLASEYRAFESLQSIAVQSQDPKNAQQYAGTANAIQQIIEHKAWSEKEHHFTGFFAQDGSTHGSGDAMVLYFGATNDPAHIRAALSYIESADYLKGIGIEEESYLAQIFYRYGENVAAYERILDLTRPGKERREYPEVSYSVIAAIVTGMMGVEVVDDSAAGHPLVRTISRLQTKSETAALRGLSIRQNLVDLEHRGDRSSTLTNHSGDTIHWQAAFSGKIPALTVNGNPVGARLSFDAVHAPVSSIVIEVPVGATVSVSRP